MSDSFRIFTKDIWNNNKISIMVITSDETGISQCLMQELDLNIIA